MTRTTCGVPRWDRSTRAHHNERCARGAGSGPVLPALAPLSGGRYAPDPSPCFAKETRWSSILAALPRVDVTDYGLPCVEPGDGGQREIWAGRITSQAQMKQLWYVVRPHSGTEGDAVVPVADELTHLRTSKQDDDQPDRLPCTCHGGGVLAGSSTSRPTLRSARTLPLPTLTSSHGCRRGWRR